VVLQAIKDIHEGQELLMWFGEDLLVDEMEIPPYLSPTNIRGKYTTVLFFTLESLH